MVPTRESRNTRRSPGSTGDVVLHHSTVHPAASAERAPVLESSMATQSTGSTPSSRAAVS